MNVNDIVVGNALDVLKTFPSNSVDCLVTSPPYWSLRDYGVTGQLGLEKTFQEYIDKLCDIFDEGKRVLKDSGTCWVVIGDTYNSHSTGNGGVGGIEGKRKNKQDNRANTKKEFGLVPDKSLCQIPARFAIEMINRGWTLRNEIIWHKPNCMVTSVDDRFTVDFEKIFFFSKSRRYFFKQQFEPMVSGNWESMPPIGGKKKSGGFNKTYSGNTPPSNPKGRNKRCVWNIPTGRFSGAHFAVYPEKLIEPILDAACPDGGIVLDPFFGSGTTGVVAKKQGKNFVGIDLKQEYAEIAKKRIFG